MIATNRQNLLRKQVAEPVHAKMLASKTIDIYR